jgi:hypothetical protein
MNCQRFRPALADIGNRRLAWPDVMHGDDEVEAIG